MALSKAQLIELKRAEIKDIVDDIPQVQSEPIVITMTSCPCGLSFTQSDGRFSSGDRRFYETMEARGDSFYEWLMADRDES